MADINQLIRRLRERFNLLIYDSRNRVVNTSKYVTFFTALTSLAVLILYYGFRQPYPTEQILLGLLRTSFLIFVLSFIIRMLFSFKIRRFLRNNWPEAVAIVIIMFEGITRFVIGFPVIEKVLSAVGIMSYRGTYVALMHLLILFIVSVELVKYSQLILSFRIKPAIFFIASFLLLCFIGSGLLMLPEMTTGPGSMNFLDALFTSTSATCVTGLVVEDTATFFTFKGHIVLLVLIQLGGIGIISFASFFAFFIKSGIGIRQQTMVQDFLSADSLLSTRSLLQQIIFYTLTIEIIGAWLIFNLWDPEIAFSSTGEKIFYSVFHSVSAFCNAGFALFSKSLMDGPLEVAYILHLAFVIMIVLGSLGFPAIRDLTSISVLRERMRKPWMQWKTSTVVAVYATLFLLAGGALASYALEHHNTLEGKNLVEGGITSLFQSATTRTAGFNTVDIGALSTPTIILFMFLMFIGASSGGTGGGIKTSTFFLILLGVYSTIRGKKQVDFRRRTISYEILNKAYSIFIFAATFVLVVVFCLSITEPDKDILQLTFEAVSAYATVGLSMGITAKLSVAGKIIIMVAMFIGRVGTLTLAYALASPVKSNAYKYPKAHMMVG